MTAQGAAGTIAGDLPVSPNFDAVYKNMLYALRGQLRFLKGCAIDDRVWIKHHQVRFEAGSNQAAIVQLESLCWK